MAPAILRCCALLAWLTALSGNRAFGGENAGPLPTVGWRGNWTGIYPAADPPLQWSRVAKGVVAATSCQAAEPGNAAKKGGQPVENGLIRDWLVIGPFVVADPGHDFAAEQIPGEADLRPKEGAAVGDLTWKRWELNRTPDYERWGTTELDWVDLGQALGFKPKRVGYVHTYLYCERPGRAAIVVDHAHGLKAWVNGKEVYSSAQMAMGLGSYVGISRQKQELVHHRSPRFEFGLEKGWNRLLVKVSTAADRESRQFKFAARLLDIGPVPYADKNILWAAELPERTNAAPVIVGDRIFTPAEPDELLCLDKNTGKILWRRLNSLYHATPEAERAGPAFDKIGPLIGLLEATTDYPRAMEFRRQIEDLLLEANAKEYRMKWDGHLASHFGIVGFTTTPVSDGRSVYVFYGHGVVACYRLDGQRRWIRRLKTKEIRYSCSPALIGGKLICLFDGLHALDAATGQSLWDQPDVTSIASLVPARIEQTDVVATRNGEVYRVADGKLLWSNPHIRTGDTGWAAPLILGNVMYLPWTGVGQLLVADFSGCSGNAWKPAVRLVNLDVDNRRPSGEWLDRWTAGSPVVWEGRCYNIDQYGVFYALDLKTDKTLYRHDVGFDELHHYNAIGVGASPALGGKHLYVVDNQGNCVVLEPGPNYQPAAVNRIESLLPRDWPIPPQEILANSPPVFDGQRLYLRGEKHLFCIGRTP